MGTSGLRRAFQWGVSKLLCAAAGLLLLAPAVASAHINLNYPVNRYGALDTDQKSAPCGKAGNPAGTYVNTFAPGSTITIQISEGIFHPGYFRVSFDDDGTDDFVVPVPPTDPDFAEDENTLPVSVLLTNLYPDHISTDDNFEIQVTLPDYECANCTLQVMQIMLDKNPLSWGDNEFYYRCADVVLTSTEPAEGYTTTENLPIAGDPEPTPEPDPGNPENPADPGTNPDPSEPGDPSNPGDPDDPTGGTPEVMGSCQVGGRSMPVGWLTVLLAIGLVRRRRRRQRAG